MTHNWTYPENDDQPLSVTGTIEYIILKGSPGCHTLPNGDPGYPPEGDEVEFDKPEITSITILGYDIPLPSGCHNDELAVALFYDYVDQDMLVDHILTEHAYYD